jgi:hypothetical protein
VAEKFADCLLAAASLVPGQVVLGVIVRHTSNLAATFGPEILTIAAA